MIKFLNFILLKIIISFLSISITTAQNTDQLNDTLIAPVPPEAIETSRNVGLSPGLVSDRNRFIQGYFTSKKIGDIVDFYEDELQLKASKISNHQYYEGEIYKIDLYKLRDRVAGMNLPEGVGSVTILGNLQSNKYNTAVYIGRYPAAWPDYYRENINHKPLY